MSDDEEYDDELPSISVNSSTRESGALVMPSAEELAGQRARAAQCERELRLLRADDAPPAADSSGSEGEAALAAAVTKLQMAGAARAQAPALAALLPPLLARLPPAALADRARRAPAHAHAALADLVCSAALGGRLPAGGAALGAAWLAAGGVAAPLRAARRRHRRALRRLLGDPPLLLPDSEESVTLKAAVLDGVDDAAARLELADALAPAPAAARLRRRLLAAALADALRCELPSEEEACLCSWAAGAWSAGGGQLRGARGALALRALGRVVRACDRACDRASDRACDRARLRSALAAPADAAARARPDRLEVLVGAAKLQLLFRE